MRRLFVTVLLAGSFLFVRPAPAHAWLHWLDEYSGPGPFVGFDLRWRLVCVQDPDAPAKSSRTVKPEKNVLRELDSFESTGPRIAAAILGAGCLTQPGKSPIASLNFQVARMWGHNGLQYASDAAHPSPTVNVLQFEPSLSVFVDKAKFVELTMGAGWSRVSGEGFDTLNRFYWRPVLITITPGALLERPTEGNLGKWPRAFSVSSGIVIQPKGFDAKDFGAIPGTFHTDKEFLATVEITFDLSRF
jgi:hypothetical protein